MAGILTKPGFDCPKCEIAHGKASKNRSISNALFEFRQLERQ
jgi:hypothetical protein